MGWLVNTTEQEMTDLGGGRSIHPPVREFSATFNLSVKKRY